MSLADLGKSVHAKLAHASCFMWPDKQRNAMHHVRLKETLVSL